MSDIVFVRRHALSPARARALVQKIADRLAAEHHLKSEWEGDTLRFERTGIHGHIHVDESRVHLEVSLGLLLKPLKGALLEEVERTFDKYLPGPAAQTPQKTPARKATHRAA